MLVIFLKTWCANTTRHIVFKFYDFFCFGIWHNFNRFSLKAPTNATCSHRKRASFIARNNLHRDEETSRVTEK